MVEVFVLDLPGLREEIYRASRWNTLTEREREVFGMLTKGQSVKEVASTFNLSVNTVKVHKFNLMQKLDIHKKAQIVRLAEKRE
jgi:DNA-binding NarL/FixJ family response regulator